MFQPDNESEGLFEKTEDSTLRDDDNTQTLSFEITTQETLSSSPSQLAANEDLLSSSAPVFIPDQNGRKLIICNHYSIKFLTFREFFIKSR